MEQREHLTSQRGSSIDRLPPYLDDYDDVDDDDENGDGTDSKFTRGDSVSSTVRVTEMSEPLRSKAENIFQLLKFFSSNLRAPSWECLPCHSTLISILALSCGL